MGKKGTEGINKRRKWRRNVLCKIIGMDQRMRKQRNEVKEIREMAWKG